MMRMLWLLRCNINTNPNEMDDNNNLGTKDVNDEFNPTIFETSA